MKKLLLCTIILCLSLSPALVGAYADEPSYIRWIDLRPSAETLNRVLKYHIRTREQGSEQGFCQVLAYIALKNSNNFAPKNDQKILNQLDADRDALTKVADNKYYRYYLEAYNAIFAGIIGEHTLPDGTKKYGVRGFFPIAKGFWYTDYDDFGTSRSFGYRRRHTGHDMMGSVGTPLIAVEGGRISEMGWNRYGGWRIGIRTDDTLRYYYYAHLRRNHPYPQGLELGDTVVAGQVIGYLGVTGYSDRPNVNMSTRPHLHFGLQLIFHPSQERGNRELWVDVFQLTRFLASHRASVTYDAQRREYSSDYTA